MAWQEQAGKQAAYKTPGRQIRGEIKEAEERRSDGRRDRERRGEAWQADISMARDAKRGRQARRTGSQAGRQTGRC
jgi:hypothetical protein